MSFISATPRYIIGLLALTLIASCASPEATTYTLMAQTTRQLSGKSVSLLIETVDIAKYLDRPQLVRRTDGVKLGISEFERWGEPMGAMIQRVLAENLRRRLPDGSTITTSLTTTGKEEIALSLSIDRFDVQTDDLVVLNAQWQIHYRHGLASLADQTSITIRPCDATPRSQVLAMSAALDQLSSKIASRLH
ncbi:PqiC family protein [Ochrobactrum sp. GPK 3]|uniref:PqiC family protein n=1 Tax=Brucella sp. 22210 TaxID=3453892 RepID=UPI0031384F89